jgi:DNA sulfur modification protein DndC
MKSHRAATSIAALYDEVRELYLADKRPWVLGFSGGKDSTCALQVVWTALASLPPEQRKKPVYVISSDTLVETPVIVNYIDTTLERINAAAIRGDLPFRTHKVMPRIDRSFWVNLIGRGYPAPSRRFRWCTERLKIEPANEFILDRVAEFGEVIMVLGVRSSESATRAQVMSFHKIKGSRLSRHSSLNNAFVYSPIEAFTTDEVWTYLLQNQSPWGNDNRDLVAMYRNAQAGECPLVVDKTTPSCGNSRFGCWVCTVVTKDKAMEAMIDSGQDWMTPLLDYRDMLAETQDPARKREVRDFRRRTGQVSFKNDSDDIIPGPYTMDFCRKLLAQLLQAQKQIHADASPGEATQLIHEAELHAIRNIWRTERGDWQDSLPGIVREVLDLEIDWVVDDSANYSHADGVLLHEICQENDIPTDLVVRLLNIERSTYGMKRRHAVHHRIEDALSEEWRQLDEIVSERRGELAIQLVSSPSKSLETE